jgi:heptosyltransferase-1
LERSEAPQFYPTSFVQTLSEKSVHDLQSPYVLCFHSTAREAKRWAHSNWVTLGKELSSKGYQVVFPWGNAAEKAISLELANQVPGAVVPAAFSIEEAFSVIAGAVLTVGVDTGLTHLAAVLGKPTVEIYCDSPLWKTDGYWSSQIRNLGDMQSPPSADAVISAALSLLQK